MSDKRFLQQGFDKCLAHAIEECGEFLVGKRMALALNTVQACAPASQAVPLAI